MLGINDKIEQTTLKTAEFEASHSSEHEVYIPQLSIFFDACVKFYTFHGNFPSHLIGNIITVASYTLAYNPWSLFSVLLKLV